MAKRKTSTFYLNEQLDKYLAIYRHIHGGISRATTVIFDRYHELMIREQRYLREFFTEGEKNLMLNNALSTIYEPAGVVPGAVLADTIDEDPVNFEAFNVDKKKIIEKLQALNLGQQFALVDWLEKMKA